MSKQKVKGSRFEGLVVEKARKAGLEASKQPGSGVFKDYPNDAVIEQTLIEAKCGYTELLTSGEKTFKFQLGWIEGVMQHAAEQKLEGAAVIVKPDKSRHQYAMVDLDYLLFLLSFRKKSLNT